MSCQPFTAVPQPPTTLPSCAVPVGGSNSSILDACCNGHINAIATYSAPDTTTSSPSTSSTPVIVNSEDNDGCFQYCITDSPDIVQSCLAQKMEEYEKDSASGMGIFGCFNTDKAVGAKRNDDEAGYASAGMRISGGRSWMVSALLGLSVLGAVVGGLIVRNLEAKGEREESGGSSFEVPERKDSMVSPSTRDSPDSELLKPSFGTKLLVALQPSKHNPNHSNSLSLLEAGLREDAPARRPAWRRLSHDVLKQALDKVRSKQ
ncbi:unnamed protein product [Alternaria alternata]